MPPLSPTNQEQNSDAPSPSNSRKEWWKRSLIRRTASLVEADLEAITEQSPFLQQPLDDDSNGNSSLVYLNRSEIRTGKRLGRGGFSDVYEITGIELENDLSSRLLPHHVTRRAEFAASAVDPVTKRSRFVLKQLHLDPSSPEFSTAASDLALEAAYLARFQHKHILKLVGLAAEGLKALNKSKNGYFLILPRLEETLEERIERWKSDPVATDEEKWNTTLQLASALEYLHENRILFRDLKPQNIGFDLEGQLQLFDFGLCRELPVLLSTETGDDNEVFQMSGVGTRRYQAPEIILAGMYNTRADVYSWAIVVWELWTLDKPYALYSMTEHAEHVCMTGERPPLDERIPERLQVILHNAWSKSVSQRCIMSRIREQMQGHLQDNSSSAAIDSFNQSTEESADSSMAILHDDELDLSSTSISSAVSLLNPLDFVSPKSESILLRFFFDLTQGFCSDPLETSQAEPRWLRTLTRSC